MLTKRLEDAKAIGLAAAELYANALGQFGSVTSLLPLILRRTISFLG
jgi:hypothetical protein